MKIMNGRVRNIRLVCLSDVKMLMEYKGIKPKVPSTCFVAENAAVIGDVVLGEDCSIWFNATVRGDVHSIRIGKNTNIQDNAVLHVTENKHQVEIGKNVTVGHGAILHGCRVSDNVIIGTGAIVLDGAEIGEWCLIGAGTVIPEGVKIPANSIVVGVPGRVIREVSDKEKLRIEENWKAYVGYKNTYL